MFTKMLLTPSQNPLPKWEVFRVPRAISPPQIITLIFSFILQIADIDARDEAVGWGGQGVVGPVPGAPGVLALQIASADPPTATESAPPQLSLADYYRSWPPPQHPTDLPRALTIMRPEQLRNPGEVERHRQLLVEVSSFNL